MSINKFSIVIPVKNETENVEHLTNEIIQNCKKMFYEIIFVNDGSEDSTLSKLKKLKKKNKNFRILNHNTSAGQSAALRTGILNSIHDVIVTLDGDCQNDPKDIVGMHDSFIKNANENLLLVGGVRSNRQDPMSKKIASKFGKLSRKIILNDDHPDTGCGIKIFHKELFLKMPYFNHMHRFLPALARREGAKVLRYNVRHRPRSRGISNYTNFGRLLVSIFDIFGMVWLLKRYPKNLKINEIMK